jgi:hypothetical protein
MPDTSEHDVTIQQYREACDASAAVRLGDSTAFATASDEDYVLRVYDSREPGPPISRLDVTAHLAPRDPAKEPDIEGAAVIEDRVYWITSHGRDKDGDEQEARQRLFATAVRQAGAQPVLQPTGRAIRTLLRDLTHTPSLERFDLKGAARLAPEAQGGLNIEGLAPTPEGDLLVGFRNPVRDGRALVVRLRNPRDLVEGRADTADLTLAGELDLGGRGLRAMEYVPSLRVYFLIGGAFDDTGNFGLFRWSGRASEPAVQIRTNALSGLQPEELTAKAGQNGSVTIDAFSDDGDRETSGKKCKKLDDPRRRSFRVVRFTLTPSRAEGSP